MLFTKLMQNNDKSNLNPIEIDAKRRCYFQCYLSNYEKLHDLLLQQKKITSGNQRKYWSACGKWLYAIFENLYFLWEYNPVRPQAVKNHLPTFIAVFNISFTITEYLISLIIFLIEVTPQNMNKNIFIKKLNTKNQDKRKHCFESFLDKCFTYDIINNQDKEELTRKFDYISKMHKVRHYLTHSFRFLWWHNNSNEYGFQKINFDNIEKIKDEIWQSLDEEKYEASFSTTYHTGISLINTSHEILANFINEIFKLIFQFIQKQLLTSQIQGTAKSRRP